MSPGRRFALNMMLYNAVAGALDAPLRQLNLGYGWSVLIVVTLGCAVGLFVPLIPRDDEHPSVMLTDQR